MVYEEFVRRVQSRARLGSRGSALEAIRASLETLSLRLGHENSQGIARQLPREIAAYLLVVADDDRHVQQFPLDEFLQRICAKEDVQYSDAIVHARVVLEVLTEAVSPRVMDEVRNQLPEEFQPLFEAVNTGMP